MSRMKDHLIAVLEALERSDFNVAKVAFAFDMSVDEVERIAADAGYDLEDAGPEEPWDGFNSDTAADADALASAGFGTDEDYGYYGGEDN